MVKDPGGGGWHMFAAVMERNLSLSQGWEAHSTIEHLHSAHSPAGPFTALGMVKTAEAHNPSVAYDPHSKQYCIYYIGRSPIAGPPETPAYPTGIADIAVTCAPSPDGWADGGPLVRECSKMRRIEHEQLVCSSTLCIGPYSVFAFCRLVYASCYCCCSAHFLVGHH